MDTPAADDEGDTAAFIARTTMLFLLLVPTACHKPQKITDYLITAPPKQAQKAQKPTEKMAVKKKKKKLYLTFDDGPNKGTKNVLRIVEDEGIPVTFFIVGEHISASTTQRALWDSLQTAQGITLCNHSYTHAHNRYEKFYSSPDSVVADFERAQDSLQLSNAIVRTPGRNIWRIDTLISTDLKRSTAAADSLEKKGFVLMGWDLEWHYDPKTFCVTTSADSLVNEIDSAFKHNRTKCRDHLVLLAHDQVYGKSDDSLQLRQLIHLLKGKEDYELSVATAYPGAGKKMAEDSVQIR